MTERLRPVRDAYLRVPSLAVGDAGSRGVWEATDGCFSLPSMFFSPPPSLSKGNETMSLGED